MTLRTTHVPVTYALLDTQTHSSSDGHSGRFPRRIDMCKVVTGGERAFVAWAVADAAFVFVVVTNKDPPLILPRISRSCSCCCLLLRHEKNLLESHEGAARRRDSKVAVAAAAAQAVAQCSSARGHERASLALCLPQKQQAVALRERERETVRPVCVSATWLHRKDDRVCY